MDNSVLQIMGLEFDSTQSTEVPWVELPQISLQLFSYIPLQSIPFPGV
jgi:hypothetical protein